MGWDMSNILVNLSSNGGGGSDPELASRVTALETTVGDDSGGLVKDVDDLETEAGDLETRVTALEQGGGSSGEYTVFAFPEATVSNTYTNFATFTLPAGTYHVIVGIFSTSSYYPATGVRILSDGPVMAISEQGQLPCCMGIFEQSASKTYQVQAKGGSQPLKGYYMVKKLVVSEAKKTTKKGGTK